LGIELFVCAAAVGVAALFAGFVWRDQRQTGRRRHAARAHQERHALMMRRESQRTVSGAAEPVAPASAEAYETPETLLVTSLTDVEAERRVQSRQQARRAEAVAEAAA
jgi:hypothetical protein